MVGEGEGEAATRTSDVGGRRSKSACACTRPRALLFRWFLDPGFESLFSVSMPRAQCRDSLVCYSLARLPASVPSYLLGLPPLGGGPGDGRLAARRSGYVTKRTPWASSGYDGAWTSVIPVTIVQSRSVVSLRPAEGVEGGWGWRPDWRCAYFWPGLG